MPQNLKIRRLMAVAEADHDLDWLKESLQAAIELEIATLPPYLCAEWSIKNRLDPVRRSIHVVLQEEMLHFGLMSNLLTALGKTPELNTASTVPVYPGQLPGGVHPGLTVSLRALSTEAARIFMEIELPEHGPIALRAGESFPTIGAFYTAIQTAFDTLQPALSETRQLEGPLGLSKIRSLDDVRAAIELIKRQGEGSEVSPEDTGPADLAHYYRFGEIYHQRKLRKDAVTGTWNFDGAPLPLPDVWPMAEVPAGGYQAADVSEPVAQLLQEFDEVYSLMLSQLQEAWADGNARTLSNAVMTMLALPDIAQELMQIPIPSGGGNYGPCFRLVSLT